MNPNPLPRTISRRARGLLSRLERILARLEGIPDDLAPCFDRHDAFRWRFDPWGGSWPEPAANFSALALEDLIGIDRAKAILVQNTRQFAAGAPANNALLWGSRGAGKSSLVKAAAQSGFPHLKLIELEAGRLGEITRINAALRKLPHRFLLFCDDLSFDRRDRSFRALKGLLEGGVESPADNVLLYATSNRRHLMARNFGDENEIHQRETVEEEVSLSDRFGLWLGFQPMDQETYLQIVARYRERFALSIDPEPLRDEALDWARLRGARSGRVAWQFITDLRGRLATS